MQVILQDNFMFNLILTIMTANTLVEYNGVVMTIADFQQLDKA